MQKIRRFICALVAFFMVGANVAGILPVFAAEGDETDDTVLNPENPKELADGVKLYKTAKSVPGYANKWEITLRIESPKTEKTSDTVIVIDRSGSMRNNNRLNEAKAAARSLAQQLLPAGNTTNRVAVVSFASSASNSGAGTGFTDNYNTVSSAIGRMSADGGTYTQSAIHMAAEMLSESTADIKTMILLSDGEPTYSVPFTQSAQNDDDNFVAYGNASETSSEVDQSVFRYTNTGRVGNGSDLRQCMDYEWGQCAKYYNNGNSAIAEAGYYKTTGNNLYAIGLEVEDDEERDDDGADILGAIASPGKYFGNASPSDLTRIFNEIGGNILALVQNASVTDTMGTGVVVSGGSFDGATSINWVPEFKLEGDIFWDEYTYQVELNSDVYNQTPDHTSHGDYYELNKEAKVTYDGGVGGGTFPKPEAKPFMLRVEKELIYKDDAGVETYVDGQDFIFTIASDDENEQAREFTVSSGSDKKIKIPMPIKLGTKYTVTETDTGENNDVAFEYYNNPEYSVIYNGSTTVGNTFTITKDHGDEIDVRIKNVYETTGITASKVWNDNDDRDGLRSTMSNTYVVLKDGNNLIDKQKLSLADDEESNTYQFNNLPKYRNQTPIKYSVEEMINCTESGCTNFSNDEYTSDVDSENYVITNTHVPKTQDLVIKKSWSVGEGLLPVVPQFITVSLSSDEQGVEPQTIRLDRKGEAGFDVEWVSEPITVNEFRDHGVAIKYSVAETGIGGNSLNEENTLYVHSDGVLEGKWVASKDASDPLKVINTWTPAKNKYTGVGEFTIKKLNQAGEPLSGVTFEVNGEEHTTGSDGTAKIVFSESEAKPKDNYSFEIEETDAPENYALIEGTEVLDVATNIEINPVDEEMTNYYEKTFVFSETTPVKGYVWDGDELVLTATDQALIKELKIVKSFEGLTAEGFAENSNISFVISGPDNYSETVGIDDDECGMSGGKLVCTISGLLPIGKYTVTEQNASIDNFTYTSEPTSGEISKTVGLGETAEFDFKNTYTSVKTASYKVAKVWEDDDDRDGIRPDDLEVTLYADGEAYGDPVKLTADEWAHEWTGLPLMNADVEEIEYTVTEASVSGYESDGGEMKNGVFIFTNTHVPATREITIKKTWDVSKGSLPTVNPTIITVELSNNGGDTQTVTLEGTDYGEWESNAIPVYVYVNQGETATYQIKETGIDDDNLDSASTLYIYNGDVLEGKWVAEEDELIVKNTWTPAEVHYEYDGESEFEILKVDESGEKALSGVVFDVNGQTKTTDGNGKIKIEVPISDDEAKEEFEFTISEKVAATGYELAEGSATITVTCTSEWASASEEGMLNIYTKTCEFSGEGDNAFDWDGDEMILTVTNKRSKAASLAIEKTFSGVSEAELQGLTFTIAGPEDFGDNGEMTLTFSDDCTVDGDVAICEVEGDVPTGEYTVKENNAELKNYTLTATGDNETQDVEKDAEVVFEIVNEYKKIDPCADGEGCGGDVPIVPPITPNTGSLTLNKSEVATGSVEANYAIGGAMVALASVAILVMGVRKEVKLTK